MAKVPSGDSGWPKSTATELMVLLILHRASTLASRVRTEYALKLEWRVISREPIRIAGIGLRPTSITKVD